MISIRRRPTQIRVNRTAHRGVTLVEIMVSLVIGLVLVGAVTAMYLSNRQAFRQVESVARLQENSRIMFEIMNRDLREAGGTPCGRRVAVTPSETVTAWVNEHTLEQDPAATPPTLPPEDRHFMAGLFGYAPGDNIRSGSPSNPNNRVVDLPALLIWTSTLNTPIPLQPFTNGGDSVALAAALDNYTPANGFKNTFSAGEFVLLCDSSRSTVARVTTAIPSPAGVTSISLSTRPPGSPSPTLPVAMGSAAERPQLAPFTAQVWYVADTGRIVNGINVYSVYRAAYNLALGTFVPEEIVEGVDWTPGSTDLPFTIEYLQRQTATPFYREYVDAASVTSWMRVEAIRMTVRFRTLDAVGIGAGGAEAVTRTIPFVISLRNKVTP